VNWHEYVGRSTGRGESTGRGHVIKEKSGRNMKKVWREEEG
jgi:hypothetical protein